MAFTGKLTRRTFLALSAAGLLGASGLAAAAEFEPVSPAQPTDNPAKVEVIEFFHYACPHCREFDPLLAAWLKKLPSDVTFRRVPVTWNKAELAGLARLYVTLEAIGELPRFHGLVFGAVQDEHLELNKPEVAADWIARKGGDRKKFLDAYNSFGVSTSFPRVESLGRNYKVMGVPTMAVDGKYQTSATLAGGHENALKVVDQLIARARAEKKGRK